MTDDRNGYKGSATQLADVLRPFAMSAGRSFVKYADESKNCSDARLAHGDKGVEGHAELLYELRRAQTNLSFPKTVDFVAVDAQVCGQKW